MRALLYTVGSPFARAIRILLDELGLDYQRRVSMTAPVPGDGEEVAPTMQVPTLWDAGRTLWDSGVIAEYLLSSYRPVASGNWPIASRAWRDGREWDDRLVFSTIQTLGVSVTTISQMTWTGVRLSENAHLMRCAERLPRILEWLEVQIDGIEDGFQGGVVSIHDIFLASHLRFVEARPLGLDLVPDRYPRISALLERLDRRASFVANPIPWWEPGVVGYEADGRTPIFEGPTAP